MTEIWKDINDYEGLYQVSNLGKVRSFKTNKVLKAEKTKNGYFLISLYKEKRRKKFLIHRLVAEAFIPNPLNLPCVNHKDENPSNNVKNNIEWCDHSYNINYGTRNKKVSKKLSKPVLQFSKTGEFIREWESLHEIQKQLGYNFPNISKCCLEQIKTAYGFIWKYKEKGEE